MRRPTDSTDQPRSSRSSSARNRQGSSGISLRALSVPSDQIVPADTGTATAACRSSRRRAADSPAQRSRALIGHEPRHCVRSAKTPPRSYGSPGYPPMSDAWNPSPVRRLRG
jgi:hypothetical protein